MTESPVQADADRVRVPCPHCGQPTDRLKRYGVLRRVVFFLIAAHVQRGAYTACPTCMRRLVLKDLLSPLNILLANLMWLLAWLPHVIGVLVATTLPGHSKAVRQAIEAAQREAAQATTS